MRTLGTLLVLGLTSVAQAQTVYSWEDAEGVHFTDDLNQVPGKHRPKMTASVADTPTPSGITTGDRRPSDRAPLDEADWRRRFIDAHRKLTLRQGTIDALVRTLPPRVDCTTDVRAPAVQPGVQGYTQQPAVAANRCRVNPQHDEQQTRIAQERVRLADEQRELEQLERDASRAEVPREWRRGW